MTKTALALVESGMYSLGLHYAFMQWEDDPPEMEPYFTGEYQELEGVTEDGYQETLFILKGWTRGKRIDLETAKEKIESYFHPIGGKRAIAENGTAVAIFYARSIPVQTEDDELKRIDIYLTVKEWKVT